MSDELAKMVKDLSDEVKDLKENSALDQEKVERMAEDVIKKQLETLTAPGGRKTEFAVQEADKGTRKEMRTASISEILGTSRFLSAKDAHLPVDRQAKNPLYCYEIERLQQKNDELVLAAMLLAPQNVELDSATRIAAAVTNLKSFAQWQREVGEFQKAMDSATAGEGLEFVPTGYSADLYDRVRLAAKVAALFNWFQMPQDPWKLPARAVARKRARIIGEATADESSKIAAVTPGSRQITFNAIKLGVRCLESLELDEDSIVAMMPFMTSEIVEAVTYAIETAIINGDTTATHMDNDTAGEDSDVPEKAWIGLRKHCQANSLTEDLSTFSTANLRNARGDLGIYGVDPNQLAWLVSVKGLLKMMGLTEVITMDKYGPQATIVTGELAKFDGSPVVPSEHMRDNVHTTGVNASGQSNDKSNLVLANRKGNAGGERRGITVKTKEDIETDQLIAVVTYRGDFQRMYGTTATTASQGINF